jgi:HSP20 family protein
MDVKEKTSGATVARKGAPDFTDQFIEPFSQLKTEVDRLFDGFPFRLTALRSGRTPVFAALETNETDKHYKVSAELPGLEPENIEVTFEDGLLRIAGEKTETRDETERGYRLSERSYGSFERMVELPGTAEGGKVDAKFKRGVLTITVPKATKVAAREKSIPIKSED